MADENTPVSPPSEQPVAPATEPSQQGPAEASSPEPVGAEPEQEKTPEVDLEAIRKQVYEEARAKTRHEVESEYGKKLSEERRKATEAERAFQEQLLAAAAQYMPDDQIAALRAQHAARQQAQQQAQQTEQVLAENAYWRQKAKEQDLIRQAGVLIEQAGYKFEDLPAEVRGDGPEGFAERFAPYVAKELQKAKKEAERAAKKAAEEATRETERRLGVTVVAGGAPVGKGSPSMDELKKEMSEASNRGDVEKMKELRDAIYREVGISR